MPEIAMPEITIELVFTVLFIILFLAGFIGQKVVKNKIASDPQRQQDIEERAAEYRRRMEEQREVEDLLSVEQYEAYNGDEIPQIPDSSGDPAYYNDERPSDL